MKEKIESIIKDFIINYQNAEDISTKWKTPLISYGNTDDILFEKLKEVVVDTHLMPRDLLEDAKSVIAYFLPFEEFIPKTNIEGKYASKEWAKAYTETNKIIGAINAHLQLELKNLGYKSSIVPATHNFDKEKLVSNWSHRHVAYIAGLGKFGLNNMLITELGCCGRIGTVVTNIPLEATERTLTESCLYKHNGSCKKCVNNCVNKALSTDRFKRHNCYAICLENDKLNGSTGTVEVCGKCLVGMPCSFKNPVKI